MSFLDSLSLLIIKVCLRSYFCIFVSFDSFSILLSILPLFFITIFAFNDIKVTSVDLSLLLKSRKEDVLYAFLSEVLVPVLDQFWAQVVGLVYKQDELLPVAHLADVLLQIC